MNLVDSSGWLEYFTDGKNARYFAPVVEDTKNLVVSTINLYEVFKKTLVEKNEETAIHVLSAMHQAKVVGVNSEIAISAARLSHELRIPMADSLILATGRHEGATVWTQDSDFEGFEGVKYIAKN